MSISHVMSRIAPYGPRILVFIAMCAGGWLAAHIVKSFVLRLVRRGKAEATVGTFLANLLYALALVLVLCAALDELGVQTASIVAMLGAAGLAIGLALQGSLSNLASGMILVIQRTFKVGDYIECGPVSGTVAEIGLFNTMLRTPDNRQVTIPNSRLTGDNIVNYSVFPTRRLEVVISVDYATDLASARKVIADVLAADTRVLDDPAPMIVVANLGESAIDFKVRPWVKREDYWDVFFALNENLKKAFDEAGIVIPFPQRVVTMRER